jgi:tyrosine-protein phosphatase SIW14
VALQGGAAAAAVSVPGERAAAEPVHVELEPGSWYSVPALFDVVEEGVYRCGFPVPACFPFLRRLGLRTVVNLLDRLPPAYKAFLAEGSIAYVHAAVKGNKAHCEEMDRGTAAAVLALCADAGRHPLLIHCR